jgi:tetratricopeptide (TPR) repeat protein
MIIPFVLLIYTQFGLDPTELYNLGNDYFQQGKYSEAITAYEQASQELSNAKVFYNLGNAYFKKGMHGKAILNYRKAQFIAPRDGDIRNNLIFVRNYRVDKISSEENPIVKMLSELFRTFSHLESQLLTTVLFVLFALFVSLYIVYRRNVFGYTAIVVV